MRFHNVTLVVRRTSKFPASILTSNRKDFSTRHGHVVSIMPPKRKRATAQSPAPVSTNPRRRSSRIVDKEVAPDDTDSPQDGLGIITGGGKRARRKGGDARDSRKDVQRAMESLQDMENQLQSAVKRQQLAVENSDLTCEVDPDLDGDTTIPAKRPGKSTVINDHKRETADVEMEQEPLDAKEAVVAKRDLDPSTMEDDGIERGARREPPVNSEMLPLPWKGRLGYVRDSILQERLGVPGRLGRRCFQGPLLTIVSYCRPVSTPI